MRRRRRRRGCLGLLGGRRTGLAGAVAGVDLRERRSDLHRLSVADDDLGDRAGHLGRDLRVDLVGHHLEERVVLLDLVALLHQPALDGPLGYRLAELRHLDRGCHAFLSFVLR